VTYNIYRSTTSGKEQSYFAAPIATGVTGTSYTDSGLVTGTTYYYVVSATNALGFEGVASAEASATAWNCTAYTSLAFGSRQVCGGIRAEYQALGGPSGFLGYPITDEIGTPDGVGRFNHFQYGSIYWTAWTGAHEVHGAIRAVWAALGWERSVLGYPLTDETMTPDWVGRYNHFAGGSIYWTPSTGAHEVQGGIRAVWASLGWERSFLGYPVSDEYTAGFGIRRSDFQHGSITWNVPTGQWSVIRH
jgi:uncharacterized protein with LGFP repeats